MLNERREQIVPQSSIVRVASGHIAQQGDRVLQLLICRHGSVTDISDASR